MGPIAGRQLTRHFERSYGSENARLDSSYQASPNLGMGRLYHRRMGVDGEYRSPNDFSEDEYLECAAEMGLGRGSSVRKHQLPVLLHIHNDPAAGICLFEGLVERADVALAVVRILAVRIGVVNE